MHHFAEYIADLLIALSDIESNVTAVAPCGDGKILCRIIEQLATNTAMISLSCNEQNTSLDTTSSIVSGNVSDLL